MMASSKKKVRMRGADLIVHKPVAGLEAIVTVHHETGPYRQRLEMVLADIRSDLKARMQYERIIALDAVTHELWTVLRGALE